MSRSGHLSLALFVALCAPRLEGGPDCERDVRLIFQAEPLGSSRELFDGAADEVEITVSPETLVARHTAGAAIVSQLDPGREGLGLCQGNGCNGLQGWVLSIGLDGDLTLVGASIEEANPDIICGGGFYVTHLVDPEQPGADGEPQGQGIISAVVFFCGVVTSLSPRGTETVLGMTVEAERPADGESVSGTFRCRDGLALPFSPPAESLITIDGEGFPFCECREITVRFTAVDSRPFRRCDASDDGRLDVSDAVFILEWLFRRGPTPACDPAADCDADGGVNITDAVYALVHLFRGGAPPPAPFPDCGFGNDPSERCVVGQNSCLQ